MTRRPPPPKPVATAFTITELLVTIAVIGVLAALLFPALGRARETARQAACASQLRQLTLAAKLYWDDFEGQSFRYKRGATNGGDLYWFGWIAPGEEGERRFDSTQGVLHPYLGQGVEICPSLNYRLQAFKRKATGASYGYGYNLHLSPAPSAPPVNMTRLKNPAGLALFADAAQINTFQAPASAEHPMLEEFYYISANEPTVHFRHHQKAMAAFCDGHVATSRPAEATADTRLPGELVAQIRADLLHPD